MKMIILWLFGGGVLLGLCKVGAEEAHNDPSDNVLEDRSLRLSGLSDETSKPALQRLDQIEMRSKNLFKDLTGIPNLTSNPTPTKTETPAEETKAKSSDSDSLKSRSDHESMKSDSFKDTFECQRKYNQLLKMYKELGAKYISLSGRVSRRSSETIKGFTELVSDGDDGTLMNGGYIIVPDQKVLLFGPPSDVFRRPTSQELKLYRDIRENGKIYLNVNGRMTAFAPVETSDLPLSRGFGPDATLFLPNAHRHISPELPGIMDPQSARLTWRSFY